MFPGMGKMNPKQMQAMMRQFGIKSEELPAEKVVIESKGKKIIIENPQINVIEAQGQKTYTIMGEAREETGTSEEDLKLVMEQTGATKKQAEEALKKSNGDIAEAITGLKK